MPQRAPPNRSLLPLRLFLFLFFEIKNCSIHRLFQVFLIWLYACLWFILFYYYFVFNSIAYYREKVVDWGWFLEWIRIFWDFSRYGLFIVIWMLWFLAFSMKLFIMQRWSGHLLDLGQFLHVQIFSIDIFYIWK